MKKFLTILVVLTAVCGVVLANEIDKPKTAVGVAVIKSGTTFKVFYKGTRTSDVKVTIYDEKGNEVFKERLNNMESFVRPYNFSSLSEGEYTLELEGENGKQIEKLSYHKGKIEKLMKLVHLAGTENKYMLTVSNKASEKLQVKIYDRLNALVYNETEVLQGDFARIYNLNAVGDKFLFEVTDQNGNTKSLTYNK